MDYSVLITGGAGFIGSHVADELLRHGYRVRALDNLCPQVHGPDPQRPDYLAPDVELVVGDVRDPMMVREAFRGIDAVFHLAGSVGVGQSMYQLSHYTETNNLGTAVLLEAAVERRIERLVVASSMSIYGEGLYRRVEGTILDGVQRRPAQLKKGDWELRDEKGEALLPLPTPESKRPSFSSVYALSKYHQEQLCLVTAGAYRIPVVALRFFNVFGPRQALSNPYTGVLAIFASRLLSGNAPLIFEDGHQQRDFVHVRDVARACRLGLETPRAGGHVFNIGSGRSITVLEVAERIGRALGLSRPAQITGKYRVGDIRHCFADIRLAGEILDYRPEVGFEEGLLELASWLEGRIVRDRVEEASAELAERGLAV